MKKISTIYCLIVSLLFLTSGCSNTHELSSASHPRLGSIKEEVADSVGKNYASVVIEKDLLGLVKASTKKGCVISDVENHPHD